jgi:hypothetical protein
MKTFLFAGFSTHKRRTRVRFANDGSRVKTLERNEHTDINMFSLPGPMTKLEAIKWLIAGHFDCGDAALVAVFEDALARLQKAEGVESTDLAAEEPEEVEEDNEVEEEEVNEVEELEDFA